MLAIGRSLMSRPKLMMLDEPSLGLAPKIMMTVFDSIRAIAKAGITILLVEQNTRAALTVAQRGYVLATGRVVYEGSAETTCAVGNGAAGIRRFEAARPRRTQRPASAAARAGRRGAACLTSCLK